jgi:lipopolysaccharide assembly protein B
MDFELQWLLVGLPLTFALGWVASRLDIRQWRREQRESPKAYYKGLNLLLNEQQDKAIDAFIEAIQLDPDTSELHFALGNLFRRRGEYERAVRVHEHLLRRADLPQAERDRAQHALAQDFLKAGLLDRAETAYQALAATSFDTEARLALLSLHERSRAWRNALEVAQQLEHRGTGSFAARISHYWCEIALEADAQHQSEAAEAALRHAHEAAPQAARPLVLAGQRAWRHGDHAQAVLRWGGLIVTHSAAFNVVAHDYALAALANGESTMALEQLQDLYKRTPTLDLVQAMALLDANPLQTSKRLLTHLRERPGVSAAHALLAKPLDHPPNAAEITALSNALGPTAQALKRYRCAACGFEAQHYFWQCPGCLSWDSYPPQRLEDLT